jgi:protein-S-isoprenylcysteine O-methyltransferase Ste14
MIMRSYLLVFVQFIAILLILLTGPLWTNSLPLLLMESVGLFLGLWAIIAIRLPNLHILPDVRHNASLVQSGPYRLIRHPMYSALLLFTAAVVLDTFSWLRLVLWLALLVNLVLKLHYEEQLLRAHHPTYVSYQGQTKRLIPWIY